MESSSFTEFQENQRNKNERLTVPIRVSNTCEFQIVDPRKFVYKQRSLGEFLTFAFSSSGKILLGKIEFQSLSGHITLDCDSKKYRS